MANNRIPRNAKRIYITWKVDTTGNKAGDRATVEKTERGWIETTESGKQYLLPIATIRNGEAVQIDQIETDATTDVLLINAGVQVYIIDGSRRTDAAALATIEAMKNAGRIEAETAERAAGDPCTIAKIKRVMTPCKMETRETATGARWTFSNASGVVLDIPANDTGYIRADKHGNLYPVDAPTADATTASDEEPTTDGNKAQEATETAQKTTEGKTTDMATFRAAYRAAYTDLYDHCGEPESDNKERYYCYLFEANMDDLQPILAAFAAYRGDLVTSDRACAAFMIAIDTVGTPTTPQNAPQGTESTTGDQTPTDGEKTPYSATDEATTGGKTITDGKKITTPASDPRQPDGNTITGSRTDSGKAITDSGKAITGDTDGGNRITGGKNITPPRTACENAPRRTETGEGVQSTTTPHKTPPRGKYKATQNRPPKFGKICAKIRVPSGALYFTGAG